MIEYVVKVSFMEIYMEKIRDLLACACITTLTTVDRDNLPIQDDRTKGMHVKGLSEYYMSSPEEVYEMIRQGTAARAVSATKMNTESSRSHSIFMVTVQQRHTETGASKSGTLYLVDLAGSEKVGKTGASGQTLEEAKKINKSLSTLGMVINALTDGKSTHVPYRDSKLTRILQESLGGNSRTTLIVNCSPAAYNAEETLSTLRFGMRAKSIKNNARINLELSPAELREQLKKASVQSQGLRCYADRLEQEVLEWRAGRSVPQDAWTPLLKDGHAMTSMNVKIPANTDTNMEVESVPALMPAKRDFVLEQELQQRTRLLEAQLGEARIKLDQVTFHNKELSDQVSMLEKKMVTTEAAAAAANAADKSTREERVQAMLQSLGEISVPMDSMLQLFERLRIACRAGGPTPLSLKELQSLEDALMQSQVALSEQIQHGRILAQENALLQNQKSALSDRNAALQQRYDLITNQIGTLEHELRVGDENAMQLAELRGVLEEHTSAQKLNISSEVTHFEQLLAIRNEETAGLTRSLDDLRASHEEQRKAMELLSASVTQGESVGPDPDVVQRLMDATWQMERARELVTLRLREYDRLKDQLMHGLKERSERIVDMEMELEQTQDHYRLLLQSLSLKTQQQKMALLEQRLEQLTVVQQRLIEQNTTLKRDVALAEKRLAARTERIEELEANLENHEPVWPSVSDSHARIAKPLRGGGLGKPGAPNVAEMSDRASPPKPSRWFFAAK